MCRDAARNHCADEFDGRNDYDLGSRFSGFRSFLEFHSPQLGTQFSLLGFDALCELDEAFTWSARSCLSGSFHIQIRFCFGFPSDSLQRKCHLLLARLSRMGHKVIGMTLKVIFQGMINDWVRTNHFINQMIFINFLHQLIFGNECHYQVSNNFLNMKESEEETRKPANNNQEDYELADNTEAKPIQHKQALANIEVDILVIMVHNNSMVGTPVVMGQSNDYHNTNFIQN